MLLGFLRGRRLLRLPPPLIILLSFAFLIALGAVLLHLPLAARSGESIGFLDALFTAASAVCVTGLVVVNTFDHWTLFGKAVILLLIQAGGLGLVAFFTLGMVLLHKEIKLDNRILIQNSLSQDNIGGMVRLIRLVALATLFFEGTGALLLAAGFYFADPGAGAGASLWNGVFHSISAFCNAGFDILGSTSLAPYRGNLCINLVIMGLIIAGGLGFVVWGDLALQASQRAAAGGPRLPRWRFCSLHSKIVLVTTAILIAGGAAVLLLFEWSNPASLGDLSLPGKALAALFQSVTLRTCGFFTTDQADLSAPSLLFSCLLMFIGGSATGTAGGIKTVTLGLLVIAVKSMLQGKNRLQAFERSLSLELLQKAIAITFLMGIVVAIATFALYFTERGGPIQPGMLAVLFEVTSAAGTVGLSTGLTPHLSDGGKGIIIACMFIGRLSPLTVVMALNMRMRRQPPTLAYPHEKVILG